MSKPNTFPLWLFIITPATSALVIAITLMAHGYNEDGLLLTARYTVRVGLPLFLLAYSASALTQFFPSQSTRWIRRNRRYIGINFAVAHFIHMGAFTLYFVTLNEAPDIGTLVGGGSVYVLIALMALTSNNWSVRTLGKAWHLLHRIGIHATWAVFLVLYMGRLSDPGEATTGIVGMATLLLFAALRATAFGLKHRRQKSTI